MPPVPILGSNEVVRTFEKFGWRVVRQRGSHIIMTKQDHIATLSIPNHKEIARGTLRSLIARSGLTVETFINMLQS